MNYNLIKVSNSLFFSSDRRGGLRLGRHGGSGRLARFHGSDRRVGFVSGGGYGFWKWVLVVRVIRKKIER